MKPIAFVDVEVEPKSGRILDFGGIRDDGRSLHSSSVSGFSAFLQDARYVCGHNIFQHDLKYIKNPVAGAGILKIIDTLPLSPLLFPARPYHALLKDDKLQTDELNNPLNDAKKARNLFYDEVSAFRQADGAIKQVFYLLLKDQQQFRAFFDFIGYHTPYADVEKLIREKFHDKICAHSPLHKMLIENPVALAYCLALVHCGDRYSITPPWVLRHFPAVDQIIHALRNTPCLTGCTYCDQALDIRTGMKAYFGFDVFRTYDGEPLQQHAMQAAVDNQSILAVFPTGGGKSITFQVPALMSGEATKGLTVVISPLQSLMKDQVDNLEKTGITEAVTINGLLDPIERAKSYERVEDGSASLLYISPESLRSRGIEHLLLGRKITRFVIDEAHCFSAWGQDFRVDYLYIGEFIKTLQEKKNLQDPIPVSCFTATAKQQVIDDIRRYFQDKLSLDLQLFRSGAARTNLRYVVLNKNDQAEKYNAVRDLVEGTNCPTIIYVSRTKKADDLARQLADDGFNARPFHGKMDPKEKTANQNAFISSDVQIMVATSAFGMGVDKKDVGLIIHHDISDSLENYVQEAGRAGRDERITAQCYVLFNEEDLNKHFILLNQTKLNIKEIQQVWKAVKEITKFRQKVSASALEIARKAGWDERISDMETRVKTAIAALENAGYLKRGQNSPRIFADSILSKTAQHAIDKINASQNFDEKQKVSATRIIKKLFSSKSRKPSEEDPAESRIDYIADHLGMAKEEVIRIVNVLREEKILADTKDLTAFIKKGEKSSRSLDIVDDHCHLENFLFRVMGETAQTFHLKALNEGATAKGCNGVTPAKIKTIINFWAIKKWIKRRKQPFSNDHLTALFSQPKEMLKEKLRKRHEMAKFIVEYLFAKSTENPGQLDNNQAEVLVEFSVHGLKEAYEKKLQLFDLKISIKDVEDALFYLSRIGAIQIEGGFLVLYNPLTITRTEQNNKRNYKLEDYEKLRQFYEQKTQQVHIVGEYAKKMMADYKGALQFVDDYFQLNYYAFLNKYFPGHRREEITKNLTPGKFKQLFGTLSPRQLAIINDKETNYMVVAAGPGSGKTMVLVHKLASLMLMEDVKHEQLLMVTFSRSAVTEFKKRLMKLIGNAALFIEIKTFHSYCFDLLGKVGTLEESDKVIKNATEKIKAGEVEASHITKTVLVIDEAQDMDADEFALVQALMAHNGDMRVIAVGDDDQNIYEFRGASAKYLERFVTEMKAKKMELVENFRSKKNLVDFTNGFVQKIRHRLKQIPIEAIQRDNGKIRLVRHHSENLVAPLVDDILSTGLSGTVGVLTGTNDEALQVTGLLLKNNMPAKLVQSNDGFNLHNLLEIRCFLDGLKLEEGTFVISDEIWEKSRRQLVDKFRRSANLDLCLNLIKDFEKINPKRKYKSDLEVFVRESKPEDFSRESGETIFVSTIHKAKGKEFDHVFLLLENVRVDTDEKKRQVYVAMTRAKRDLTIHLNGKYLDDITAENLERIEDREQYTPPSQLAMQLGHKDVRLGFFTKNPGRMLQLMSGDVLEVDEEGCSNGQGQRVLKFSNRFREQIEKHKTKGYHLKEAKVNFIVYWKDKDTDSEVPALLPEVYFER